MELQTGLSCSVDGVMDLNVDGEIHSTPIEIKTFSALERSEEADAFANNFGKLNRCTFGDKIFKKGIKAISYRVQVLHHTVVFKTKYVLFIIVGKNSVIYMFLISFTDDQLKKYLTLLEIFVIEHLKWTLKSSHDGFPSEILIDKELAQGNYDFDVHSIKLQFALWKQLHQIIEDKSKLISRCLQIVPNSIVYWNKNKLFVDVMSRLLSHIKIPFKKADPVLQLIVRFTFIM